jgi:hypothetical protein
MFCYVGEVRNSELRSCDIATKSCPGPSPTPVSVLLAVASTYIIVSFLVMVSLYFFSGLFAGAHRHIFMYGDCTLIYLQSRV